MMKKNFSPFKMKFSIQEEGGEKQIFFTFKEATEKTSLPSKTILRVLNSGRNKYFRRSDEKTFWIKEEITTPFIQIDGKDFFSAEQIQERFGISRTVFFNQLAKKKTHFLDSQEKSHEVTWKSSELAKLLELICMRETLDKVAQSTATKGMHSSQKRRKDKRHQKIEVIQNGF